MTTHDLCTIVGNLAQHVDRIDKVSDVLDMLQQCFLSVFRKLDLLPVQRDEQSAAALESTEESKLQLVKAVYNFHTVGAARHTPFFHDPSYNPHSALFIHELLGALTGPSSQWFRALQLESIRACVAVVHAIGWRNVRLCVPGVVSATVQYIHRAHTRKDARAVRLAAMELLHSTLTTAFSTCEDVAWVNMACTRLPLIMHDLVDPTKLMECGLDADAASTLQRTIGDVMCALALTTDAGQPTVSSSSSQPVTRLVMTLSVTYAVLANLVHLAQCDSDNVAAVRAEVCRHHQSTGPPAVTDGCGRKDNLERRVYAVAAKCGSSAIRTALMRLRGVDLLHLATTVLRVPVLRPVLLSHRDDVSDLSAEDTTMASPCAPRLIVSVVRRCTRLVARHMPEETLFTHRRPRPYPCGVVDEFLESLAHALTDEDASTSPCGETEADDRIANADAASASASASAAAAMTPSEMCIDALMTDAESVLCDWESYALHPATLYVHGRILVWMFKPPHPTPCGEGALDASPVSLSLCRLGAPVCRRPCPLPWEFVSCGAWTSWWSLMCQPHLWNIAAEAEQCSRAQVRHRQCVAAVLLRLLSLIASDVMSAAAVAATGRCPFHRGPAAREHMDAATAAEASHSVERFVTAVVYAVMEKAATSGVVHEAAVHCVRALAHVSSIVSGGAEEEAEGRQPHKDEEEVNFVLHVGARLVDEASRAARVSFTRLSAAAVLRGAVTFLINALSARTSHVAARATVVELPASRVGTRETDEWDSSSCLHPVHSTSVQVKKNESENQKNSASRVCDDDDDEATGAHDMYRPTTSLVALVAQRLSSRHVRRWLEDSGASRRLTATRVEPLADFLTAAVTVATESCVWVRREGGCADVERVHGMRAILSLMQDIIHLAVRLLFASPLQPLDELNDRHAASSGNEEEEAGVCQTTSWHVRVCVLQTRIRRAMHEVMMCGSNHDANCAAVVSVLVSGLTVFLTTRHAVAAGAAMAEGTTTTTMLMHAAEGGGVPWWPSPQTSAENDELVSSNYRTGADSGVHDEQQPPLRSSPDETEADVCGETVIQLPRGHLKTVYRIYLCLLSMLREPVARFNTTASSVSSSPLRQGGGRRRAVEQREMERTVAITPGVFALLEGLEALLMLAHDFLMTRMVEEVLPLVLVWHERSVIPRAPTPRERRLTRATREFAERVVSGCDSAPLRRQARRVCAPFFDLVVQEMTATDGQCDATSAGVTDKACDTREEGREDNVVDGTLSDALSSA